MGVILKENNLIYTDKRHEKFLGSSCYKFDKVKNQIYFKEKLRPLIPLENEKEILTDGFEQERNDFLKDKSILKLLGREPLPEKDIQDEPDEKRAKKREYKLNKKKVREKCAAFFGLKRSRKFLAFYTFSFPCGFPDENALRCLNSVFTSMRTTCGLKSYLRVTEYQKNGTIHFHLLTNNYMYVRRVNSLMAKAIQYEVKKYSLSVNFDVSKYNGVDVKHVNNNRKALNSYLTKYVSKNNIVHEKIPYHSSRDISELFTAESFTSVDSSDFRTIRDALTRIKTFTVDSEYCTIEYLNQKQDNGKFFTPPDGWYWLRDFCNEQIYNNHHGKVRLKVLPLS